jgi:hypothetical protein
MEVFWPLDQIYPKNRCCISLLNLIKLNVGMCVSQLRIHKMIQTPPTWQENALTKRNIMYWPRAVLPTYLTLLCETWCAAPMLHCDRPARNSASDWVMRRVSSSTHPRQDRCSSYLKFLEGKSSLTFRPAYEGAAFIWDSSNSDVMSYVANTQPGK